MLCMKVLDKLYFGVYTDDIMKHKEEIDYSPPSQPSIEPDDFLSNEKGIFPQFPNLENLSLPDIDIPPVKQGVKSVVDAILTLIHLRKPGI